MMMQRYKNIIKSNLFELCRALAKSTKSKAELSLLKLCRTDAGANTESTDARANAESNLFELC